MLKLFIAITILFNSNLHAAETCSRIAIINNQEVLVDANTSDRGEGLRYHLDKDPAAKEYLDTYQKNSRIFLPNTIVGTLGTGIFMYGLFSNSDSDRNLFLIGGVSVLVVNFFIAKTLETNNESNLQKAVEEYNKKNLPKIYFSPEENRGQIDYNQYKVGLLNSWNF